MSSAGTTTWTVCDCPGSSGASRTVVAATSPIGLDVPLAAQRASSSRDVMRYR
jgi:hypothetical protein